MSSVDFLEKLQKLPRYVRIQIMWGATIVCLVVIFCFWIWSLGDLMAESKANSKDGQQIMSGLSEIGKDVPTLWSTLGAGIGNVYDSVVNDLVDSPSNDLDLYDQVQQQEQQQGLPLE